MQPTRFPLLAVALVLVTLSPLALPPLQAQTLLDEVFSEFERQVIERYLARKAAARDESDGEQEPSEKEKKGKKEKKDKKDKAGKGDKQAPPGLAKRKTLPPGLAKRETLPPGLAKREFPPELLEQLPAPPPGTERVLVDGNAVLIEVATQRVLDVIEGVLAGQ